MPPTAASIEPCASCGTASANDRMTISMSRFSFSNSPSDLASRIGDMNSSENADDTVSVVGSASGCGSGKPGSQRAGGDPG